MAANEETSSCCDGKSTSIVTRDEFNLADRLGCLFRREFYHIIPFYVLVLIPSASALAYLFARFVDPWIQSAVRWWVFPVAVPMRYYLFGLILAASGLGVLWVYSYPHSGRRRRTLSSFYQQNQPAGGLRALRQGAPSVNHF